MRRAKAPIGNIIATFAATAFLGAQAHQPTLASQQARARNEPCASGFPRDVCASPVDSSPEKVLAYWTEEKMAAAVEGHFSSCGPPPDGTLLPDANICGYVPVPPPYDDRREISRVNGVLFFVQNNNDSHCSASVIISGSKSLVLTAAHCLHNGFEPPRWHTMAMFVPAYNGYTTGHARTPLGRWPVRQAFVPHDFVALPGQPVDFDVGVIRVYRATRQQVPAHLQDAVRGGLYARTSEVFGFFPDVTIAGYPSKTVAGDQGSYGDGRQYQCLSHIGSDPDSTAFLAGNCTTSDGNSGGPLMLSADMAHPPMVVGVVHNPAKSARLSHANFTLLFDTADNLPEPRK